MIDDAIKRLIEANTVGLVATVAPDGTPRVSPKGTMLVLDAGRIAFSDIRSPGTARNLRANPAVEVNFVDVLRRQAARLRGVASYRARGEAGFDELAPAFRERWPELADRMRGIVVVEVREARRLFSPVYDLGASEAELERQWLAHYAALVEGAAED